MFAKHTLLSLIIAAAASTAAAHAQAVSPQEAKAAMDLYSQRKYAAAAASFEGIIRRAPTATYCYYAALAQRASGKEIRAKQLFQFVVDRYPNSVEAGYAKQVLGTTAAAPAGKTASTDESSPDDLPESVRALIPPEMQSLLNTPDGKRAIADAMKQNAEKLATIKKAESNGVLKPNANSTVASAAKPNFTMKRTAPPAPNRNIQPFTAENIAKAGSNAIDQMYYPNCWFECSMAALADLPRGQKLLASMIKGGPEAFVVRFPGDGVEYVVTLDDLKEKGIHDSALWASLIEAAQTMKFPDDNGGLLEDGLACLAGCKAEVLRDIPNCTPQEISSFIGGAVTSKNPIVCGTKAWFNAGDPILAFPTHAYTIIGFDPAHNMITIRNPHGKNGRKFFLPGDPHHENFEQLENGVFKMSIPYFQKYFRSAARAFI